MKAPVKTEAFRFAVYPGSEKIDLGDKRVACLCQSEAQAKHMAVLWAPYGYYEAIEEVGVTVGMTIHEAIEQIDHQARDLTRILECAALPHSAIKALEIVDCCSQVRAALGVPAAMKAEGKAA